MNTLIFAGREGEFGTEKDWGSGSNLALPRGKNTSALDMNY